MRTNFLRGSDESCYFCKSPESKYKNLPAHTKADDTMTGLARHGEIQMTCPFCGKGKVNVYHKEGFIQAKTSRISAGGKQTFYKKPDEYHVQNDCPECGKSKKEIERAFETGITRKKSHQEKLNRLKEAGLPTRIEG